jgi:hypothetical protein
MKSKTTLRYRANGTLAAALLTLLSSPGPATAFDVIDPAGGNYSNVNDSSHYSDSWTAVNLFTYDLTGVATGTVLGGSEYAKSGTGASFVSFELDQVYAGVASVFYAQRGGNDPNADKVSTLSLWASETTPFGTDDPGVAPNTVVSITNSTGGLWSEYLLTNVISGQYFLVKFDQNTPSGNPGGNELRLGASLGLAPVVVAVTPASTDTYDGNSVQFKVQAMGTAPLSYQWQAGPIGSGNFTNLVEGFGATGTQSADLALNNLLVGGMDVQVIVTNAYGSTVSTPATLTVSTSPPQIITQPSPAALQQPAGYSFSIRVEVAGSLPMSFQWKRDGLDLSDDTRISGAKSNVLTVVNAQASDAGKYRLVVSNSHGNVTSEESAVTIVPSLPVISPTGSAYSNVTDSSHFGAGWVGANLFAMDVTGLAPGSTLGGSEYARSGPGTAWVAFQVDAVYTVGSFYYSQRAGSNTGDNMQRLSIWSSDATPFTATDPGTAPTGVFSLLPNVGTPVWREYFLTSNITGRYFLLKLEQTTITGNPGGNEFRLGLAQQTVAITSHPTNQTVFSGNTAQFTVAVSGADPMSFQWQARAAGSASAFTNVVNGAEISGAASATLVLRNVPLANIEYRAIVSNVSGSATSDPATLTVISGQPEIVSQPGPASLQQPIGYGFTLSASVVGSGPMAFQWQRNGQSLADDGRITGTRSNVLTVAVTQPGDAGTYRLLVSNGYGSATSLDVVVTTEATLGIGDGSAWTLNGGAAVESGVLTLTDGGVGQARSAFFNARVPVDDFSASFVYQDVSVGGADGAALVFHNAPAGPAALGPGGGYLGYAGIEPSAALLINLYGTQGISVRTGGVVGGYASSAPVNVAGGAPIAVSLKYASGTMVVTLTDMWTTESYTNTFAVDLPQAVGGHTAYVGFTGADGAVTSIQQVSQFEFVPLTSGAPQIISDVQPPMLTQPLGLSLRLAAGVSGTSPLTYQWKHNGVALIDDDRVTGANSNVLTVASTTQADAGNYQLYVTNFYGWTNSSVALVTMTNRIELGDGTAWTRNGGPTIINEVLALTDAGAQARSAFLSSRVPIDGFIASFTYTDVTTGGADGMAFVVQNSKDGAAALGAAGGSLGYSGITPSAAIEFNIYSGSTGGRGFAFATNGFTAENGGAPYSSTAPVDLAGGHPIDVVVRYVGGVLSLNLTDTVDLASFATNVVVDLPSLLASRTAYVGFTGATGGVSAQQEISNVEFVILPSLSIRAGDANSVIVSWPVGTGDFELQKSSDLSSSAWATVPETVSVVDGRNQVSVAAASAGFFRLRLR